MGGYLEDKVIKTEMVTRILVNQEIFNKKSNF